MKRKYFLILCFFLLLGGVKANASAYFTVDGFRYMVNDSTNRTVTVTSGTLVDSTLTVPASVTYEDITYSVTSIKLSTTRTFRSQLRKVVLPEG